MNGDLSRVTFNPLKHFTRVVTQQGRVQTDADANEQVAILLHYLRTLAADLIGQHGGPEDSLAGLTRAGAIKRNCGFGIIAARKSGAVVTYFPSAQALSEDEKEMLQEMIANNQLPLRITGGHYYVDGLLCESEKYWRYSQQPDLWQANDDRIKKLGNGTYLLYLDVSEHHVTALEDPSIREVALGGADTGARTKLVWQVRVRPEALGSPLPADCKAFDTIWPDIMSKLKPPNRGRLQADAKKDAEADSEDPCISSPEARFRGIENQLYRVEIHKGGPALNRQGANREDAATFKWSRDNGTVVAPIERKRGDELIVSGLRDFSRWFAQDNWVEITHDALELNGVPGTMARVTQVDGESLTIDSNTASGKIYEPQSKYNDMPVRNLKVRRWDHRQLEDEPLRGGAILLEEGEWMELEDGVVIRFEPPAKGGVATEYRTGDYWLIPARVSTGDVEWPTREVPDPNNANDVITEPEGLPPHGIEHHYAPLATITLAGGEITAVLDLRHKFPASAAC